MLELVPGLRERPRDRMLLVRNHPGEELHRGGERADARGDAGERPQRGRRGGSERAAGRRRDEQGAEDMRAVALMLPRARLAVLVAPDRDMLGSVVLGEL